MMQSPDEIYVFRSHLEERGAVELVQTVRLLDEAHQAMAATSTIRVTPDGRLVLAANRPSNTITVFSRQSDGTLVTRERVVDIPGDGPRDFHISGDGALVVTAMQHSDQVYVLKIDYENKTLLPLSEEHMSPPAAVAVSGRCRE